MLAGENNSTPQRRILLVEDSDDDAELIRRMLTSGRSGRAPELVRTGRLGDAIERIRSERFDAILLDLHLPDAAGLIGIHRVKAANRLLAIVVLTGLSDHDAALRAVQVGAQDYLVKGAFDADLLERSIGYAIERARIRESERVLLEETLHGCVKALTGVLALANPKAFGRAMRLKRYVRAAACRLGIEKRWPIEVAAMLSQVGCVTLSPEICDRLHKGLALGVSDQAQVDRLPELATDLVRNIPRLESVAAILAYQQRPAGKSREAPSERAPRDAQILQLALEFDRLETRTRSLSQALRELVEQRDEFEPEVVEAFCEALLAPGEDEQEQTRTVADLRLGTVLAEDVVTRGGRLLIARGNEVSESTLNWLRVFAQRGELPERIRVVAPCGSADSSSA